MILFFSFTLHDTRQDALGQWEVRAHSLSSTQEPSNQRPAISPELHSYAPCKPLWQSACVMTVYYPQPLVGLDLSYSFQISCSLLPVKVSQTFIKTNTCPSSYPKVSLQGYGTLEVQIKTPATLLSAICFS